nr:helix-turn-helix domain-containing protein [uncultured Pseudomonas sp.]
MNTRQHCQQLAVSLDVVELLTPTDTANILGLSPRTLATWRSTGRHGLPFIRCGGRIRYRRSDLATWLEHRRQHGEGR